MLKPDYVTEIFLQPGDFYFGDVNTRIRTLLGSCVSITMWHPTLLIGGMCHYLLPEGRKGVNSKLDGRYAEDAMLMFLSEIKAAKTRPSDYRVKLFGGGNMFRYSASNVKSANVSKAGKDVCIDVPCKNVLIARTLAAKHGFRIDAEDLGGNVHRHLIFDVWSGDVWVRKPVKKSFVSGE